MRFRHPDGSVVHLAYCTNVHPAETLDGVLAQLRDHCEAVRRRLGRDRLGIGLWLAHDAARTLDTDPAALRRLRGELDRRGLEVVTLNGFPYQGFGAEEVKYRVYRPDWADLTRLEHTTALARVLTRLLPDDAAEGTVSTLPLAWRTAYDGERAGAALTALRTLGRGLDRLHEETGRSVRVGLEAEPGCVIETTADTVAPLTEVGHPRIGVCVDTCHLATSFEAPGYTVANICWWYAMGADTDITVTPRPVYYADGRKEPDCYTRPPALHDELTAELGTFPLFNFWGPGADLVSSRWIIDATRHVLRTRRPDLALCYLPHLDYDLQRYGPDDPRSLRAATELDAAVAPLLDEARAEGRTVVALSEYGITPVSRPVDVNRVLRRAGLLEVHTQDGMEYPDPMTSRAFAVADHQIAHVYVRRQEDRETVRALLAEVAGVAEILDDAGRKTAGLDHPRAGELVLVAEPDSWFTYYYWLDDARAPDFAQLVEIHRKPGYDPAELFMDPLDPYVKVKAAGALARKKLGLRYRMAVVPLDPSPVRGSHGRLPEGDEDGPLLLCSAPHDLGGRVEATEVKNLLLRLAGLA